MFANWQCYWSFRQVRNGQVIWSEKKSNLLVTEGGKAITDTFLRANDIVSFPFTNFWICLYRGSISKATTLATLPGEPSSNGYVRSVIERSNVGWPTIELDDESDWRVKSKEVTITASGGSIGPVDGAALSTSLNNTGSLIGVVATSVQRTILPGDSLIIQLMAKIK